MSERGKSSTITDLWLKDKNFLAEKSVQQIINFCAEGKLIDRSSASEEFRAFLKIIPSELLSSYATECLESSKRFDDSGLALQDIVNQIGARIGFTVQDGLYRGKANSIGFDGIWKTPDNYSLVVEVKTTDAYRINLDSISEYRTKLSDLNQIPAFQSSILIIVGRQDTGDLEAQIRGSRHAWDIRLVSVESLIKLMQLRETLDDIRTMLQIAEILKPQEYTRIDRLIDVIFSTSKDVNPEDDIDEADIDDEKHAVAQKMPRFHPVSFHQECIDRIQQHLGQPLIKKSRSNYGTSDNAIAVVCSISKTHVSAGSTKYWFAFHPYYEDFLRNAKSAYIAYGCGSPADVLLIPFNEFKPLIKDFWTTQKDGRMYYHVVIYKKDSSFHLKIPNKETMIDISAYRIS
jgi:hypothetical protein